MTILRYLIRDLLKSQAAVLLVLLGVFLSQQVVSLLARTADGRYPVDLVGKLIALTVPELLVLLLPLSFFLAVLLAYGRMYADQEMVVLRACGVSEWYVTRVTLVLALLVALLAGWASLVVTPWAKGEQRRLIAGSEASAGVKTLSEGRFKKSPDGSTVMFIEQMSDDGNRLAKVFVAQTPDANAPQQFQLLMADSGELRETADGTLELSLNNGTRWDGSARRLDLQRVDFERYTAQLPTLAEGYESRLEHRPLADLLADGSLRAWAEIHWRLAVPISLPLLCLMAVPLSAVNPRQGKFAKLGPAILLFLGYYVLLMAGQKALESGRVPLAAGLWWVHGLALLVGAALVFKGRPTWFRLRGRWLEQRA